jgi:hypothetical protein
MFWPKLAFFGGQSLPNGNFENLVSFEVISSIEFEKKFL